MVIDAPEAQDAVAPPGATGHLLYTVSLAPEGTDATLTDIAFRTNGGYLTSDIGEFQLRFSEDDILDAGDPELAALAPVATGSNLTFSGLTQTVADGGAGHLFLTADIGSTAGGGRTIFISAPSDIVFSESVSVSGTPSDGGVQTFESARATLSSQSVSDTTATQGASDHVIYGLKLSMGADHDAAFTDLTVATGGTYADADLTGFALRFSEDETLSADDPELAAHAVVASGGTLAFSGFSQTLPADSVGYLFITVDVAASAVNGRTLSVAAVDFADIGFEVDPEKIGSNPVAAGKTHTLYAPPKVETTTPAVPAATVAQGTPDYPIYTVKLSVSDNDATLTALTLVPRGTYTAADIDRFRLYASADDVLDAGDALLAESGGTVSPGQNLVFDGFSQAMNNGDTVYLIATMDVSDDAEGNHNLYIDALSPDGLAFDPADTEAAAGADLTAGGGLSFPISPYTNMAAGFYHTLALKLNGTVWAWGNNENGQIGDGTTDDSVIALPVAGLTGVVDTVAGDYFSLALLTDGTLRAWGQNDFGQLGDGTFENRAETVQVSGMTDVLMAAAGDAHGAALKADGTVWTWGGNRYGQLGDGTTNDSRTPLRVSGLTDVIAVAAGGGRTLALKFDGTVWAWGQNDFGQLGDGTTVNRSTPVQVSGLTAVEAIAAGDFHSLALKSDKTAYAWGNNENGQLGDGTTTNRTSPVLVSGLAGVESVAAGNRHSLALLNDGTVRAWGWNAYGQLGDGTQTDRNAPVAVAGLADIKAVAAGGDFSLALDTGGVIRAWGHNRYGQLGDGGLDDQPSPVPGGIIPIIEITAPAVVEDVAPRGGEDHILYRLRFDVTDADAALTDLVLTTGGNYGASDLAGEFRLYISENDALDAGDPLLGTHGLAPSGASLAFTGLDRPILEGTTRHLFVTVDIAPAPTAERRVFIDALSFDHIGFAERNVFKSGDDPLTAGGAQIFPALTVEITAPNVPAATVSQNTSDHVVYRLNLNVPDPAEEAILTGLALTTGGDYRLSDLAGGGFKLRFSADDALDDGDAVLGISEAQPGVRAKFEDLSQPVTGAGYLFVTVDAGASAGGDRTLSIGEISLSDIAFDQTFVSRVGDDPLAAGGAATFPMATVEATAAADPATVGQSVTDHILYDITLTVGAADVRLDGLTLTPEGSYAVGDIGRFRLFFSPDATLEPESDPVLAEHVAVSSGTPLVFADLSRVLRVGTGHFFLTADIGDFAVARTVSIAETDLDNLEFDDAVRFEPDDAAALAAGGVQTFPTPKVSVSSPAVPAVTVEQDTPNHPVYRIDLVVSDARAVLERIGFVTAGTYVASDIDRFRLRLSEDDALDDGDADLGSLDPLSPGDEIVFENLSQTIEKGTTGHLFLTADIGAANGGRTVGITETPLERLIFQEPEHLVLSGTDPAPAGAVTTFPVPAIAVSAPEVAAATIEQEVPNLVIYRVILEVTRADAVMKRANFTTVGDYIPKDLAAETPFKLRYSSDDILDEGDAILGAKPFVNPGENLDFTGLARPIPKGTIGHLFVTADIDRANGARTLSIGGIGFDRLEFEFGDKTGTDPLAAGGVQTFPIPAITIAAPVVPADPNTGQHVLNHVLYRFDLSVERAEAVLRKLTVRTAGNYMATDLAAETPFKLWYSGNDDFNAGDARLSALGFAGPNSDLIFDELSQTVDKETTGYFFITVDIGEAVGRHIALSATPLANLVFEFGDKLGDDPAAAGADHQFPVSIVDIASTAVPAATVEPRAADHLLYRLSLHVSEADAVIERVEFPLAGTYRSSDIRTDCAGMDPCNPEVEKALPVFKLWFSNDDVLEKLEGGDDVLADSLYAAAGETVVFDGFQRIIDKDDTDYLFLTVNIGPAAPDRTIYVDPVPFTAIGVSYRDRIAADPQVEKKGDDPLPQGGVQTFAKTAGGLLAMDGVDDSTEIPYSADLNPTAFTVSVRASAAHQTDAEGNTTRTRQTIVASIDEGAFSGYEIFVDEDNKLKLMIGTGDGWEILEGPEVIDNRFYDVSAVYDGQTATLYVNGDVQAEAAPAAFSPNGSAPLTISAQPDGESDLNGQVSDLYIWNVARPAEDIAAGIETPPTGEENGVVAHYGFIPWGTLVDSTGNAHDGTLNGSPQWASVLSGLWIGQIEITAVSEVGYGSTDTETPYDVANPFDMTLLLHVDDREAVRLLRHVTLMQRRFTVENEDGTTEERVRRVLITDDDRLYDYEGVVRRDGKLVGVRLGSLFFDFDPNLNALLINGGVRAGGVLSGDLTIAADHPHNPFKHLYHPDHRSGRNLHRAFTLTIDPDVDVERPQAGAFELAGVYEETFEGLHKLPIRLKGNFQLERVSIIPVLNDGE